jgi:hypothetical protein
MDNGLKGYMAGRAVMGNVVGEMRRSREDYQRRSAHQMKEEILSKTVAKFLLSDNADSAFEFLNDCFMDEVIADAQHQKDRSYSLDTILEKRKAKYLPYYERIGKAMPEKLAGLTADELCETLGVENLHVKDHRGDKEIIPYERKKNLGDLLLDWWAWILLILFGIGFVVYMKYLY